MNLGIDLGTTNSALAFIDSTDEADYPTIHVLTVPQYVAPGRIEELLLQIKEQLTVVFMAAAPGLIRLRYRQMMRNLVYQALV